MDSKRRAELRSEAQELSPIVMVGKNGITDEVVSALNEALEIHELVKVRFQAFKKEAKELSNELESKTDSELVCVTGFTAVYFKYNPENH